MKHPRCMILSFSALAVLASAALTAENRQTVKGRIREVSASTHRITLATDGGKELTFRVDKNSRLERKDREVGLDEFKKGMRVKITYESRGGERRVVSMTPVTVSAEEVRTEIREALQSAKSYTYRQRDKYRERLERVLKRADNRIDELRDQAAQAGDQAKKKYHEQIKQLRRVRDKARTQLKRLKSATPEAWEDFKSGVRSAFEDLRKAFE